MHVLDRRAHRAAEEDVDGRRDRQPDRRRARRSQPQRRDRQGAPPRPRARPSPVKPGEEKEEAGGRRSGSKARAGRAPGAQAPPSPKRERAAPAQPPARTPQRAQSDNIQYRSIGPGGFVRQGPGDQQAPIPPAPPRRLVPAKPSPEVADKTSLLDLNDRICKWPMGHPGEPDFHFCGNAVEPGLPVLRRALRSRLPGAAPAPRPPPAPAAAVRRIRSVPLGFRRPASRFTASCSAGIRRQDG